MREPTVCPDCGAVYQAGRWQSAARPAKAHEERCQACQRLGDDYPAEIVRLSGAFLRQRRRSAGP